MRYSITWMKGERVCRCNGEPTTNKWMLKTFGSIGEVWLDKPGICHVGNIIYCDDPNIFRKYAERVFQRKIEQAFNDTSLWLINGVNPVKEKLKTKFDKIRPYKEVYKIDLKGLKAFYKAVDRSSLK